ncbi:hypothetical protein E1292_48410 [Nonomuraea deserti]|uniref:Oxygen sensor histidine kinase NreB n=1 Tax=Nonomuraea deserti TaxID=1848322 RepID=A0A4V6PC40_9ACTN|nr:histidine kinase [Nonomuraea deserti]TDC86005.1 hypothetical protein E1292_48410 [Nonomuraea deserti]
MDDRHPFFARRLSRIQLIMLDLAVGLCFGFVAFTMAVNATALPPWMRIALPFGLGLLLSVRRLWPLPVFCVTLVLAVFAVMTDAIAFAYLAPAYALYIVALSDRVGPLIPSSAIGGLSLVTLFGLTLAGAPQEGAPDWLVHFDKPLMGIAALGGSWTIGRAVHERRHYAAREAERLAAQAVTDERLRIARELHDVVTHSVGLIAVKAGVANHVMSTRPEEAHDALRVIETASRSALVEMRHLLGMLRSTDVPDLVPAPGIEGLEELAEQARLAGVDVELKVHIGGDGVAGRVSGSGDAVAAWVPASGNRVAALMSAGGDGDVDPVSAGGHGDVVRLSAGGDGDAGRLSAGGGDDVGPVSDGGNADAGRVLDNGDGSSGVKRAAGAIGPGHESLGAAGDAEKAGNDVGGRGLRGLDGVGLRGETTGGGLHGRGDEGPGAGASGGVGSSWTAIKDEAGVRAVGGRQKARHDQRVRLPDGVGLSVYRIVQEALTNVAKHAAPARCQVSVVADGKDVRIEVMDDGPGRRTLPSAGTGHGLIGIRERVMMYGGTFEAGSRPGRGFRVFAQLPYQEAS